MHDIFSSAKRPFFASCTNLNLGYIDEKVYKTFIRKKFTENKRSIDDECLNFICDWTKCHTFYTQYFCNTLYAANKKQNKIENAREVAFSILKLNESTFYQYRSLLTDAQWNLLRAIAKEEKLFQPQAKRFISQYQLDPPALVKRGLDALLKKEIVLFNSGVEKPFFEV